MEDSMVSKPNKTMMSKLHDLVLLILFYVYSCTGTKTISLTWAIGESDIALVCQVKHIFLQVEFLHESIPIGAYCLPPHPIPLCTRYKDGSITQDLETNCTILVLNSNVKEYRGTWSCKHGVNRDESEVVFIGQQDIPSPNDVGTATIFIILCVLLALMTLILCILSAAKLRCKLKERDNEYPRVITRLSDDCLELQDNEYPREITRLSDDCLELQDTE